MISNKELSDIKKILDKVRKPLFFFDDDEDGLCSYLLLKRHFGKGEGVFVKGNLYVNYSKKAESYGPDYVFILDKPVVTQEFIDDIKAHIIWIDHHTPIKLDNIKCYNPRIKDPDDRRPVSYWCYKIVKKDLWIATVGCIGDWYLPEFSKDFSKKYGDLLPVFIKDPGNALFKSKVGELCKIFNFILKGKSLDIRKCLEFLEEIESPYEILNKTTNRGKFIYDRFEQVNKHYKILLEKAMNTEIKDNVLLFTYSAKEYSLSNFLSNELIYNFPDVLVIVAREKDDNVRLSLRSQTHLLPKLIEKALYGIDGYGGGHEHACGGNVAKKDFIKFIDSIKEQIKNQK
ncbi:MAG: DHH family phosphoesterase [Candidatus Woesearchaeota archaeon]